MGRDRDVIRMLSRLVIVGFGRRLEPGGIDPADHDAIVVPIVDGPIDWYVLLSLMHSVSSWLEIVGVFA
jgi:hypothetical protein